jgi:FixJ family two-component response regulator
MMGPGSVLLLDDDADIRDSFSELVPFACGRDCLAFGSYAELTKARESALACEVAILDINLGAGQPSGIDAYDWLRAKRFAGRIVFLTGHAATHPLVRRAAAIKGVRILAKPISVKQLRDTLTEGAA